MWYSFICRFDEINAFRGYYSRRNAPSLSLDRPIGLDNRRLGGVLSYFNKSGVFGERCTIENCLTRFENGLFVNPVNRMAENSHMSLDVVHPLRSHVMEGHSGCVRIQPSDTM